MLDRGAEVLTDTGKFLRALFPLVDEWSLVEMRVKWNDRCPNPLCVRQMCVEFFSDRDLLEETALKLAPVGDVYVGVNTRRDSASGKKSNLAWGAASFVDLDVGEGKPYRSIGQALDAVDRFDPLPDMRVMSGGGLHLYWLIDPYPVPLAIAEELRLYEAMNRRLCRDLRGDAGTWNADRILRLPGTLNHKFDPPALVKLL